MIVAQPGPHVGEVLAGKGFGLLAPLLIVQEIHEHAHTHQCTRIRFGDEGRPSGDVVTQVQFGIFQVTAPNPTLDEMLIDFMLGIDFEHTVRIADRRRKRSVVITHDRQIPEGPGADLALFERVEPNVLA